MFAVPERFTKSLLCKNRLVSSANNLILAFGTAYWMPFIYIKNDNGPSRLLILDELLVQNLIHGSIKQYIVFLYYSGNSWTTVVLFSYATNFNFFDETCVTDCVKWFLQIQIYSHGNFLAITMLINVVQYFHDHLWCRMIFPKPKLIFVERIICLKKIIESFIR